MERTGITVPSLFFRIFPVPSSTFYNMNLEQNNRPFQCVIPALQNRHISATRVPSAPSSQRNRTNIHYRAWPSERRMYLCRKHWFTFLFKSAIPHSDTQMYDTRWAIQESEREIGEKVTEKTRRNVSSTFKMRVTPVKVTFGAQYLKQSQKSVCAWENLVVPS